MRLSKIAARIQARAIRRCGELLKEIEVHPETRFHLTDGDGPQVETRKSAAEDAGLSERQQKTAIRVANVPSEEFEAQVESDSPPTVTALAELDGEPLLVDGRNRREACRRAGVVPDYVLLDGQDPVAYIFSANITRRHMTKSQRAMVVARIYPEAKRGRGNKDEAIKDAETAHFKRRIQEARFVLRHAPDLADSIINGTLSLDKAYEEAKIRKGRAETYEARFNALKATALSAQSFRS